MNAGARAPQKGKGLKASGAYGTGAASCKSWAVRVLHHVTGLARTLSTTLHSGRRAQ